jgi:hypothetical protein
VVLVLGFRDEDERGLVIVFRQMAIDTVVRSVQAAADKPLPEWRMIGVQRGVPILIPVQQLRILPETFREILFAETLDNARIVQVGLRDEAGGRANVGFFYSMHGDLRFGQTVFLGCGPSYNLFFLNSIRHDAYSLAWKRRMPTDACLRLRQESCYQPSSSVNSLRDKRSGDSECTPLALGTWLAGVYKLFAPTGTSIGNRVS